MDSSILLYPQTAAGRVSQVSHSWRMVALACSSLWGHVIDFARGAPEWTEELLRRLGKFPIDLYLRSNPLKIETFARELQHFGHARIFYLMQWLCSGHRHQMGTLS